MFKFLKRLFSEEKPSEEKVSIGDLREWFNSKSKEEYNKLDSDILTIKNKIKNEKGKTKNNLEILKNAKLQNPNIPFKAKQMMEGNRDAYIRSVNIFLGNIDLEKGYDELLEFCSSFDNLVSSFGKSTAKSFHILQEFFSHESGAIAVNIKNFDKLIKELKERIKATDFSLIEKIKNDISDLNNKIKQKEGNKKNLSESEEEKSKLIKTKEGIEQEINKIKKSDEFGELSDLKQKREEISSEIKDIEAKLIHSFSILEKAFKKYVRMAYQDEDLLKKYIEMPIKALIFDKELKILKLLDNVKKNILKNAIELDGKKKNKSLEEIERLDKEFFNNFLKRYDGLKKELSTVEKEIDENKTLKKINELNEKLEDTFGNIENINNKIENLKTEIEKVDVGEIKKGLEKEINYLLKRDVVIG